ncbi:hypothetical protein [[Haemophilus] ducreyi]|uniref:hypothetical protein n=1 Tax=Haemophilus ducreyi TaxID=730 RepID=UPI0021C41704|nr:hypothetical protein [[Haemophilus] ducreyi]
MQAVSPGALKGLILAIFVCVILFAYAWSTQNGYSGLFSGNKDIFDYLKLVLSGAALVLILVAFFVY